MPSSIKGTRFGLLRHATTMWNAAKRVQGHSDSPLTKAGEQNALKWGRQLKGINWQRMVCSDLGRTRQTARLINQTLGLPLNLQPQLREQNWGQWTGWNIARIESHLAKLPSDAATAGWNFSPPAGESRIKVRQRSMRALVDIARQWPGETILTVTHEGVIKCLIYELLGRRFLPFEPRVLKPYHLHWVTVSGEKLAIEEINALSLQSTAAGVS